MILIKVRLSLPCSFVGSLLPWGKQSTISCKGIVFSLWVNVTGRIWSKRASCNGVGCEDAEFCCSCASGVLLFTHQWMIFTLIPLWNVWVRGNPGSDHYKHSTPSGFFVLYLVTVVCRCAFGGEMVNRR